MNMTNQYKILALDLDGTLLDAQSRITPENARAVRMAQQAGVQIVLCTGRNVREVRRFSEQLEAAPDWLVTANGAAVQHPDDREPAFFDGLSTEMVDIILDECAAIDTDPCLYTTGFVLRTCLSAFSRKPAAARTGRDGRGRQGLSLCWGQECVARCARRRAAPIHQGDSLSR